MHTLVDGYNLMYELGLLPKQFGPDGFRKARSRFLNDLAAGLGAVEANQTTVVFDARDAPGHLPRTSTHKGISVVFADEEEGADARIERLIAVHPAPKSLTVVSTDRRIRQAAGRRKARVLTADGFWTRLESPRAARPSPEPPTAEEVARTHGLAPGEAARWLEEFRDVAVPPEAEETLGNSGFVPSADDIARIEREVEDEFRNRG
jgi:predicted RNA-binding protein with PIN domain